MEATSSRKLVVAGAIALLAAAACGDAAGRLRQHTYPPSFEYVDSSRLSSAMWVLASETARLDRALEETDADPAVRQREVASILAQIEAAADGIQRPGQTSQHPLLNEHLPRFRERVRKARAEVERSPPAYYLAGTVAGSCAACHALR